MRYHNTIQWLLTGFILLYHNLELLNLISKCNIMSIIPEKYKNIRRNFLMDLTYNFNIAPRIVSKTLKSMHGGGSVIKYYKHHEDNEDNEEYTFKVLIEEDDEQIQLTVLNFNKADQCIIVLIYKDSTNAILQNLTYDAGCALEGLKTPKGGNVLMNFIIKYLKSRKSKYNVNRILLSDISFLLCHGCGFNLNLSRLRAFTHNGLTYYMKFGFKPYNDITNGLDHEKLQEIGKNNDRLKVLSVKDVDIIGITNNVNKNLLPDIKKLMTEYHNLKQFIIRLVLEKDKYCCIIEHIMKRLFDPDVGQVKLLTDFYHQKYYLDI